MGRGRKGEGEEGGGGGRGEGEEGGGDDCCSITDE